MVFSPTFPTLLAERSMVDRQRAIMSFVDSQQTSFTAPRCAIGGRQGWAPTVGTGHLSDRTDVSAWGRIDHCFPRSEMPSRMRLLLR